MSLDKLGTIRRADSVRDTSFFFYGREAMSKPKARRMAPEVGFEPTTNRLTADRSTTELLRNVSIGSTESRPTEEIWLRGLDLNQRPSGYEPDELPGCSTPRKEYGETAG
jgi:hypothetical protein